jgi:hypothetical protein
MLFDAKLTERSSKFHPAVVETSDCTLARIAICLLGLRLVKDAELTSFQHEGFWQPMDTLREKNELSIFAQDPNSYWMKGL